MKTFNNRRGILSTFLKFSFQRGWIAENPSEVPHYRIRRKRGVAQTFTVPQARTLMEHFETFEGGRWCHILRSASLRVSGPACRTAKSPS